MTDTPWPPPTTTPITRTGWYLAEDGEWYATSVAPAAGWELGDDDEWRPALADDEQWRNSRWGFGDFWWGVLVYLVVGVAGTLAVAAVLAADSGDPIDEVDFGAYSTGVLVLISAVGFFGVPWLATHRKGLRSLARDFGLRARPLDLLIGFGLGIAALIAAALVSSGLDAALDVEEDTSNVPVDSLDGVGQFVVFLVAVGIVTPIVEEVFFRGLVHRSFLKRGSSVWFSFVATTVIFVIPHLSAVSTWKNAVTLAGAITALGATFHLACHLTKNRLGAPIVAHMVVNSTASVALFLTDDTAAAILPWW